MTDNDLASPAPADASWPAFPVLERGPNGLILTAPGMTLRDYFMAHAPAEPQPWFRPVMPPAPHMPAFRERPEEVREELHSIDYADYLDPADMSPAARRWHESVVAAREKLAAYTEEQKKQRYLQWPAAWADAVLKARTA